MKTIEEKSNMSMLLSIRLEEIYTKDLKEAIAHEKAARYIQEFLEKLDTQDAVDILVNCVALQAIGIVKLRQNPSNN